MNKKLSPVVCWWVLVGFSLLRSVVRASAVIDIISPDVTTKVAVGDILTLVGTVNDDAGNVIDDGSNLLWEVRFYAHPTRFRTFLSPTYGNNIVLDPIPEPPSPFSITTSFFRIMLSYNDETDGSVVSTARDIDPQLVLLSFDTVPSYNYLLVFQNNILTTPADVYFWDNQSVRVVAPDQRPYLFDRWLDGSDQERIINVSSSSGKTSFVAYFYQPSNTPSMLPSNTNMPSYAPYIVPTTLIPTSPHTATPMESAAIIGATTSDPPSMYSSNLPSSLHSSESPSQVPTKDPTRFNIGFPTLKPAVRGTGGASLSDAPSLVPTTSIPTTRPPTQLTEAIDTVSSYPPSISSSDLPSSLRSSESPSQLPTKDPTRFNIRFPTMNPAKSTDGAGDDNDQVYPTQDPWVLKFPTQYPIGNNGDDDDDDIDETTPTTTLFPLILGPVSGTTYSVGDELKLIGIVVDSNGRILDDDYLRWDVIQYDNLGRSTVLGTATGNRIQFDPIPQPRMSAWPQLDGSYIEITLTATNDDGAMASVSRTVEPKIVVLEFDAVPNAVDRLRVGRLHVFPPENVTALDNQILEINAFDLPRYTFVSWSDGGNQEHNITVSSTGTTKYVATYTATTSEPTLSPSRSALPSASSFPSSVPNDYSSGGAKRSGSKGDESKKTARKQKKPKDRTRGRRQRGL